MIIPYELNMLSLATKKKLYTGSLIIAHLDKFIINLLHGYLPRC